MQFKEIQLSDKEVFDYYFSKINTRTCDASFGCTYVWKNHYNGEFAIVEDKLVIKWKNRYTSFSYPIGEGDARPALEALRQYCKEKKIPLCLSNVTKKTADELEKLYPGELEFVFSRDIEDYIYETEALITLKGKKYHGKRNHINRFRQNHVWNYEKITAANKDECLKMLQQWKAANCPDCALLKNKEKAAEICAARDAILYLEELGFVGGAIRAEGNIIAFAIGEAINEDTFVVHFEKAFGGIQGDYPMINQQFAEHEARNYRYINREEDMGEEGLRKSKLSYHPVMMAARGLAYFKSEEAKIKETNLI